MICTRSRVSQGSERAFANSCCRLRRLESKGLQRKGLQRKGLQEKGLQDQGLQDQGLQDQGLQSKGQQSKGRCSCLPSRRSPGRAKASERRPASVCKSESDFSQVCAVRRQAVEGHPEVSGNTARLDNRMLQNASCHLAGSALCSAVGRSCVAGGESLRCTSLRDLEQLKARAKLVGTRPVAYTQRPSTSGTANACLV